MGEISSTWGRMLRWGLWLGFLLAWTTALLLPVHAFPPKLAHGSAGGVPLGKVLHVSCYALLAGTLPWLPLSRRGRWLLLAGLSLHAFGTEFAQSFVPTRGPSLADVGLDHVGLALGVLTWLASRAAKGERL